MRRAVSRTTTAATQRKKRPMPRRTAGTAAEAETHQGKRREEDVHPHLHAHPSPQWNCPAAHTANCKGGARVAALNASARTCSGMLIRDARDCRDVAAEDA